MILPVESQIKQYALITGASGGIGYELSEIMAKDGHNLILAARNIEKLNELSDNLNKKYNVEVVPFKVDLTSEEERTAFIDNLRDNKYHVSILMNNAGFGDAGCFAEANWTKTDRMIQLNVTAITHLTRELLPAMIDSGYGKILNIASIAGFLPGPYMSVYYASKSYVISFSAALREELKNTGVTVTALCPGPVQTNFFNFAGASESRLNTMMKPAEAKSVAYYGYKSMMKGKGRVVHGLLNKLMVFAINFIPAEVSNPIVKRLHT